MEEGQKRCEYFLERKGRSCRMLVKCGQKFCGEHAGKERNRIPCPFDPKHTVDEELLQEHLTKCNSRLPDLPYVQRGINEVGASVNSTNADPIPFSLGRFTHVELKNVIDKVELVYSQLNIRVEEAFLEHESMKQAIESESYGQEAKRHLRQQSSILGHADRLGVMNMGKDVCYVEFGAGRAKLSYWLAKAVDETARKKPNPSPSSASTSSRVSYVLIERSGQRYKFENKIAQQESMSTEGTKPSRQLQRIRCAIEHVDLRLVDCVRNSNFSVAFCKHLCGSGSDAALRCLVNATEPTSASSLNTVVAPVMLAAALLATCCHHRCEWRTFTGQKLFVQWGFNEDEFKILTSMSSWATCGLSKANDDIDRKSVGKKCKLLLDYARSKYLEENGKLKVSLCYYVSEYVTPENLLLIVTPVTS